MERQRSHGSATSGPAVGPEPPVERFHPNNGVVVGWVGIAVAVGAVLYCAVLVRTSTGLRIGLGAAFAVVVVWVTQLRPRVTAYRRHLLMKGILRDVAVPYAAVDEVTMGQTLNVWANGRRYRCIGIGLSIGQDVRQRMRAHGQGGLLGINRVIDPSGRDETPVRTREMSYESFVMTRIDDLRAEARAERATDAGPHDDRIRSRFALPEVAALLVTAAAFVASLLL